MSEPNAQTAWYEMPLGVDRELAKYDQCEDPGDCDHDHDEAVRIMREAELNDLRVERDAQRARAEKAEAYLADAASMASRFQADCTAEAAALRLELAFLYGASGERELQYAARDTTGIVRQVSPWAATHAGDWAPSFALVARPVRACGDWEPAAPPARVDLPDGPDERVPLPDVRDFAGPWSPDGGAATAALSATETGEEGASGVAGRSHSSSDPSGAQGAAG